MRKTDYILFFLRAQQPAQVDPTNQDEINDAGGWSGFAAIRVGDEKLVLGWPGIPDDWCWPNQNKSGRAPGRAAVRKRICLLPNLFPSEAARSFEPPCGKL